MLLAALAVSSIGDEITLITLTLRTAQAAAWAIPLLLIGQLVPALIAAPFVGRWIDRGDPARLLLWATLAQAMLVALLAFSTSIGTTLAGASMLGLLFAVSGTATFTLIPVLAQASGLTLSRANALLEAIRSAGMLAGPVVGGLLVAWGGTRIALVIDAASFGAFAIVLAASGLRRPAPNAASAGSDRATDGGGYRAMVRDRRLMVLTGALSVEVAASAIADVAFVFLVTITLAGGATMLGILTACWAAGMLGGSALAGTIPVSRAAPVAFASAGAMGATMLAIGFSPLTGLAAAAGVAIAFGLGGAANSIHNVSVRTVLQDAAPPDAIGRVAALYVAATRAATIAGFLLGGLFVPGGAPMAYVLGGSASMAAGVVGWLAFRRR